MERLKGGKKLDVALVREGAKMIDKIPDYSNPATKKAESNLGVFKYDRDSEFDQSDLIDRGPYELDNGAVYKGQWSREGLRWGRGVQLNIILL